MSNSSEDEKPVQTRRKRRANGLPSLYSRTKVVQARHFCPKVCAVCGRTANGYHYEAPTCCGCKAFFRRIVLAQVSYVCDREGSCAITSENRVFCRSCRFEKCVAVGMNPQGIRTSDDLEANPVVQRIAERKSSEASTSRDTPPVYYSPPRSFKVSELVDSLLHFELEKKTDKRGRNVAQKLTTIKRTTDFDFLKKFLAISKRQSDRDLQDSFGFLTCHPVLSRLDKREQSALLDHGILPLFNFHQAFSLFERKDESVDSSNPICKVIERSLIDPIERIDMKRKEHVLLKTLLLYHTDPSTLSAESNAALEEHKIVLAQALFSHCMLENESRGPARFVSLLSVMNRVIGFTALQKDLVSLTKMTTPVKKEPIDPDY